MQALLGIEGCAETQNLKQPDVLMLQYLLPELFTPEQVRTNWDYYDPRTDHEHGSSLGPEHQRGDGVPGRPVRLTATSTSCVRRAPTCSTCATTQATASTAPAPADCGKRWSSALPG